MSKIEKARAAERLWADDLLQEVITGVRERQVAVFLNARSTQEQRDEAHNLVCALAEIEGEFLSLINRGKVALKQEGQHRGSD